MEKIPYRKRIEDLNNSGIERKKRTIRKVLLDSFLLLFSLTFLACAMAFRFHSQIKVNINGHQLEIAPFAEFVENIFLILLFSCLFAIALLTYSHMYKKHKIDSIILNVVFRVLTVFSYFSFIIFLILYFLYEIIVIIYSSNSILNLRIEFTQQGVNELNDGLILSTLSFYVACCILLLPIFAIVFFLVTGLESDTLKRLKYMAHWEASNNKPHNFYRNRYKKYLKIRHAIVKAFFVIASCIALMLPLSILGGSTSLVINKCEIYDKTKVPEKSKIVKITNGSHSYSPLQIVDIIMENATESVDVTKAFTSSAETLSKTCVQNK